MLVNLTLYLCVCVQTASVFEHLRHSDPDTPAGGAHSDLASEGAG